MTTCWFAFFVDTCPLSVTGLPYATTDGFAFSVSVTGGAANAAAARAVAAMQTAANVFMGTDDDPTLRRDLRGALVTGGTGRVGGAIAARLAADGWSVLAAGRADGDVSRPEQARALVERASPSLAGSTCS